MKKLILLLLLLKGVSIMAQIPSFSITGDTNHHFLLIEQSPSGSLFVLMTDSNTYWQSDTCTLFKSVDQGSTWISVSRFHVNYAYTVDFEVMNDSTFLYTPSWEHDRVCKLSIRNGITLIDTMLITIPFSAEVFNMSVLHENGFAVIKGMDNTVFTQDGGVSFQSSVFQNNTGSSIDFTTSNIEVIKSNLAYVARNQGFYSSVDSCRTWQRVANLYGLAGNPRVSFANSDIGFLFNVKTIVSTQDLYEIWMTSNGGLSWSLIDTTDTEMYDENALKAFPNGAVYYTYLQNTLTNDHLLYLAHSSDFGLSWNTFLVDTLDRFGAPSLAFNDSEHGFLTAYADVIYEIQRDSLFAEVDNRAKENTLLKLFPNPTSSTFSLQSSVPIRYIEIYSIDNRLLQTIEAHSKSLSINTDGLQNGIYLVRLFSANGHLTTKKVIVL